MINESGNKRDLRSKKIKEDQWIKKSQGIKFKEDDKRSKDH